MRGKDRVVRRAFVCAAIALASVVHGQVQYSTGSTTVGVALGDLNGDGAPDIAAANQGGQNVSVLLANGVGGFGGATNYATGVSTFDVALGDLDSDGALDFVAVAQGSSPFNSTLTIHLNDGSAVFSPTGTSHASGTGSYFCEIADLDGDTIADVAVANFISDDIAVMIGNGGGGISSTTAFASGNGSYDLAVSDLNRDGMIDLASANGLDGTVSILLGNGIGGFAAPSPHTVGTAPFSVASDDMNGDGFPDLATFNVTSSDVSVVLSDGLGGYLAAVSHAVSSKPQRGTIGDVNRDGNVDLVASSTSGFDVSILHGDGNGGFAPFSTIGMSSLSYDAVIGDVDADGLQDLVTAGFTGANVTVYTDPGSLPTGLSLLGTGTGGCDGLLSMGGNVVPALNTPSFGVTCTNAPALANGLVGLFDAVDATGSDPLGWGVTLHIDLFASSFLFVFSMPSDSAGSGFLSLPIPNDGTLTGLDFYTQVLFVEPPVRTCTPSPFGFVTSNALKITIQP